MDVSRALAALEGEPAFDFIFMDPPYGKQLEEMALSLLQDSTLADQNTVVIIEADLTTSFSYVENLGFSVVRVKDYKTNRHVFLRKMVHEQEAEQ